MNNSCKVAIVTGASKGLGLEICRQLYQDDVSVVAVARDVSALTDIQAEWGGDERKPNQLLLLPVDATDQSAVQQAVDHVVKEFGRLDIVINNVGGLPATGQFSDLSESDWLDCFRLNVMSMVNFCQASYAYLALSPFPRVVNMASITAVEPGHFNPHYSACKAAVLNLSKHLANSWAANNILVNCISAATFDSPSLQTVISDKAKALACSLPKLEQEFKAGLTSKIPLGRLGTIDEVAALTLFLVSEKTAWITGANICIDGGKHKAIW